MFDEYQFAGIMEKWIESFFSCNENFVRKKLYIFYHLFILRKKKCFYLDIFFLFSLKNQRLINQSYCGSQRHVTFFEGAKGPLRAGQSKEKSRVEQRKSHGKARAMAMAQENRGRRIG